MFVKALHPSTWFEFFGKFAFRELKKSNHQPSVRCCAQSCQTLCGPLSCGPPASSVSGIFQAGILERVAIPSSWRSSRPGIEYASPGSPPLQEDSLLAEPWGEAPTSGSVVNMQSHSGQSCKTGLTTLPLFLEEKKQQNHFGLHVRQDHRMTAVETER